MATASQTPIGTIRRAYDGGGWDAFWGELETLGDDDFVLQFRIARAFFSGCDPRGF